ncbi:MULTISPECIES: isochorismatase [unclassified Bosea (in: a-proteobacteria)]|uniref:isochorismatase family protein n=1 Tax=unclassified Bosea (in: a-proteobacteria) TaxID=2653178 RepID=UPI000F74F361|nr:MULTISPECIES: isochorismatase [unclassified Bosea (in: a-proteobacteria)]AZO78043.1 isochorismatase [Bosea sp. Tri-49]RXT19196.1 isochorismatase [Bosea sp. Tri-39]RXT41468.1 isochorismatase [Bosea sp. Tri-54]
MAIPQITDYAMPEPSSFPANRTQWRPDPKRAVLLIHDMQRYFLRFYDAKGELLPQLIANLVRLRDWARANGVPVVYTAQPHEQPAGDRALLNDMWGPGLTVAAPDLQEVVAELAPGPEDIVLTKWRYSAFKRSDLLERMRGWERDQLVISGVYAHIGCMVTAVDAFMSDIQPFLVGDAVADFSEAEHRMALRYVATRCGALVATDSLAAAEVRQPATREWLQARVLELIEDETELDPEENLIFYGLDSVQVMVLAGELKERGVTVGFDDLARVPTLNAWWALIEQRRLAA